MLLSTWKATSYLIQPWKKSQMIWKLSRQCLSASNEATMPEIIVLNSLKKTVIDIKKVEEDVKIIFKLLKLEDFGVYVEFVTAVQIRSLNHEWRNIYKSTDVLSFPLHEFRSPGVFVSDREGIAGTILGEIIFSPAYIKKRCQEDHDYFKKYGKYDNEEDRGVSKLMATKFTFEERIPLLLIHSILHLIGYDHENEEDWMTMTKKEDEITELYYQQIAPKPNETKIHP